MKIVGTLSALLLTTAALTGGCGVGPYHTPDVAPVVMPEPEEDIFADLDFDSESGGSTEGTEQPAAEEPPAEEPPAEDSSAKPEGESGDAKPAAGDKAEKPAEKKKK